MKPKIAHAQNDMNKSSLDRAPPLYGTGENGEFILRGHETNAYFHFAPWPPADIEQRLKQHFNWVIKEQRGIFALYIDLSFLSLCGVGGNNAEGN